jgi:hypothetical protein
MTLLQQTSRKLQKRLYIVEIHDLAHRNPHRAAGIVSHV